MSSLPNLSDDVILQAADAAELPDWRERVWAGQQLIHPAREGWVGGAALPRPRQPLQRVGDIQHHQRVGQGRGQTWYTGSVQVNTKIFAKVLAEELKETWDDDRLLPLQCADDALPERAGRGGGCAVCEVPGGEVE